MWITSASSLAKLSYFIFACVAKPFKILLLSLALIFFFTTWHVYGHFTVHGILCLFRLWLLGSFECCNSGTCFSEQHCLSNLLNTAQATKVKCSKTAFCSPPLNMMYPFMRHAVSEVSFGVHLAVWRNSSKLKNGKFGLEVIVMQYVIAQTSRSYPKRTQSPKFCSQLISEIIPGSAQCR